MKKVVLIIFTSAIWLGAYAQLPINDRLKSPDLKARLSSINSATCPADSGMAYHWNSTTATWDLRSRQLNTYNQYNYLTLSLTQNWNMTSNAYEKYRLTAWTYDLNNNLASLRDQLWSSNDNQWTTINLVTNEYDEHNNNILRTQQLPNGNALTNNNKTICTYDDNNLMTSQILQSWDIGSSTWINQERTTNSYASNGTLNSYITETWDKGTNAWIDNSKSIVTYSSNGDRDIITQTWNPGIGTWITIYRNSEETIIIADGHSTTQTGQIRNSSNDTWKNSWVTTDVYNTANNLTEFRYETWDDSKGMWVGHFQYLYEYDADNNMVLVIQKDWDIQNSAWINNGKYENYYDCTITEVSQNEITGTIQVSPNPSKGQFNFNGLKGENTITIYDLQGRQIQIHQSHSIDKTVAINLNGEKSGMYFYRVIDDKNRVRTGKLIIE